MSGHFIVCLRAADHVPHGLLAHGQRESARRDDGGSHESEDADEASLHARKRTTADADCCDDSAERGVKTRPSSDMLAVDR